MGKVVVINWVTLDGVMQAPGKPDEDTRDGFDAGGWATPFSDEAVGAAMGERMSADFAWLFGRRTYDGLLQSWNTQGGPFRDALNDTQKYVASSSDAPLKWPNSTLLHGDISAEVSALKRAGERNLVIMGSGVLIGTLMGVIDEYLLLVAPLVLGRGRRLFGDGAQASLRLVDATSTSTGVVITSYASV